MLKKIDKYVPIKILGAGSNTLIRDGGISGVTIHLAKNFSHIHYPNENEIIVGGGLNCTKLSRESANKNIQGMEFFSGIPGTIGGAIKMNAGAYGHETSNILKKITTVNRYGKIKEYNKNQIRMGYRKTSIKKNEIIIEALFKCEKGKKVSILQKITELNKLRKKTQPVKLKTSGSTFKNPIKFKAWKLIKDSGCSNIKVGGARISSLHSNFIVNKGIASAKDVEDLGKIIIDKVHKRFGIKLNWEIKIIGSKKHYRRYFNA